MDSLFLIKLFQTENPEWFSISGFSMSCVSTITIQSIILPIAIKDFFFTFAIDL